MSKHTALSPKHANSTSPSAYLQCGVDSPPLMTVGGSVSVTCSRSTVAAAHFNMVQQKKLLQAI